MKIELHILQNFAPSNLNRDDTGAPKDCELGGYRRGRISSQCLKRAIRQAFVTHEMFEPHELAVRTKRLVENVANVLEKTHGRAETEARRVVAAALPGAGLAVKGGGEDRKTQYLLFLPRGHIQSIAKILDENWDALVPLAGAGADEETETNKRGSKKQKKKKKKKKNFPNAIGKELSALFEDARKTPDLALFGRMIADSPSWNVEAACQVAHAISTNRVAMDFDFYTAVDDLRPEDTAGSDMMGTVQFNSSCFYRYSVLDVGDLRRNLGAEDDLVRRSVNAWIRATVLAIPTGKQNSMAAHNPPSFVLAIVRESGSPVSLANAFARPVRPQGDRDLVSASIEALQNYLQQLGRMYGSGGQKALFVADRPVGRVEGPLQLQDLKTLEALVHTLEGELVAVPA